MKTRAIVYGRVSSDDERKTGGRNLQSQIEDGRAYCDERGYEIVGELAEDVRGASGADWDLPEIGRALDMARAGAFDVLVTRELDRFARGLAKQLVFESEFKRAGVRVEYVLAEYDDTPEGQLTKHVRAIIAEYEKAKIAQRMRRGRRDVVKAGKLMLHGNAPPFGFALVDGELALDPEQAAVVRLIFQWFTQGDEERGPYNISQIAHKLSEMKAPTWADVHGSPFRNKRRGVGQWAASTVGKLLSNETYCGRWSYGKRNAKTVNDRADWLPLELPPHLHIIDRATFEAAQERRQRNKRLRKRNVKYHYLLRGRVVCGLCGSAMIARQEKGKYQYYRCPRSAGLHVGQQCSNKYWRAKEVDQAVFQYLVDLGKDPERLRAKLEEAAAQSWEASAPLRQRLAVVVEILGENRGRADRILEVFLEGHVDKETFLERKAQLEQVVAPLERERANLQAALDNTLAFRLADGEPLVEDGIENLRSVEVIEGGPKEAMALVGQRGIEQRLADFLADLGVKFVDFTDDAMDDHIERLDMTATLTIEGGQKWVWVKCAVGEETLPLSPTTLRPNGARVGKEGSAFYLLARLPLGGNSGDVSLHLLPRGGGAESNDICFVSQNVVQ